MKALNSQAPSQAIGLQELKMRAAPGTRSPNKVIFAIFVLSVELTELSMLRTQCFEGLIEATAFTHLFPLDLFKHFTYL